MHTRFHALPLLLSVLPLRVCVCALLPFFPSASASHPPSPPLSRAHSAHRKKEMGAAQSAAIEGLAEEVNMTKDEIQRMYVRFKKLDKNNSGGIDANEFMQITNIANNPLAHRVISIFDDDGGGEVEFDEFVRVRAPVFTRATLVWCDPLCAFDSFPLRGLCRSGQAAYISELLS